MRLVTLFLYPLSLSAICYGQFSNNEVFIKFRKEVIMLNWAVTFFVIAIIAAVLGFTSIAGSAIDIAKILFFVFLILAVVSFVFLSRALSPLRLILIMARSICQGD